MPVMGIDYGTSYTTACWWNPKTGVPEVIRNEHGDEKTPSVVFRGAGETLVGKAALEQLAESAHMAPSDRAQVLGRTFKSAKLLLKDNVPLALPDGSVVTPVELAADVLKHLKRVAE